MPKFLKTVITSLLLLFISLFTFTPFIQAQEPTTNPPLFYSPYAECLDSPGTNICKFNLTNFDTLIAAATKRAVDFPQTKTNHGTSLMGSLSIATGSLYANKPVNTAIYLADITQRFKGGSVAYAATGSGWDFLSPTLELWKTFRNVSYLFFIIIFVALGFMIMFRAKLNPQTVIGVQQALPRIIVSLLLVTFSYAIASLTVDLTFFSGELASNLLTKTCTRSHNSNGKLLNDAYDLLGRDNLRCTLNATGPLWSGPDGMGNDPPTYVKHPNVWPLSILTAFGGEGVIKQMAAGLGVFLLGAATHTSSASFAGLFLFIIAMTVVSASFKIFFVLLSKYVTLIITTIFMPLGFLVGAMPGKQNTNTQMIKSLLSAALAFPAVMVFLGLAYYFSDSVIDAFGNLPPFYTNPFDVSTAGISLGSTTIGTSASTAAGNVTASLIAIGMLTVAPQIPATIDKALEAGPGVGAGASEIGSALKKLPLIGNFIG